MKVFTNFFTLFIIISVDGYLRNRAASPRLPVLSDMRFCESEIAAIFENKEINERRSTNDDATLRRLDGLINDLETFSKSDPNKIPAIESPLIDGVWKLLYTSNKPGTNSPIQRTVTASDAVSIYQVINLFNADQSQVKYQGKSLPDVSNVVCFGDKVRLRVTALASTFNRPFVVPRRSDGRIFGMNIFGVSSTDSVESARVDTTKDRIDFAFQEARFEVANFPQFTVPYPVPFKLLGDEAKGWLDTTYLSESFTVKRGNKGTLFFLERIADLQADKTAKWAAALVPRADSGWQPPSLPTLNTLAYVNTTEALTMVGESVKLFFKSSSSIVETIDTLISSKSDENSNNKAESRSQKRVGIIFPAQLSTGEDYDELSAAIQRVTADQCPCYPAPLARFNWPVGLVPSFFSREYLWGSLQPAETLSFYFKKIDRAVEKALIDNSESDVELILVGHSIGGWVARAWLSGWASPAVKARVKTLLTLGSPHNPPPAGSFLEKVDQTRGLLTYINSNYPGACEEGVRYASVIGGQIQGGFPALNVERTLAFGSYFALAGDGNMSGDGIIPIPTSQLEGAELLTIEGDCRHSNFVPTIGKSVKLPVQWYGSEGVIDQWATYLS